MQKTKRNVMTTHQELDLIFAYENGDLTEQQTLHLFGHLIKSGMIRGLQGHYQRTARFLIDQQYVSPSGDIIIDLTQL